MENKILINGMEPARFIAASVLVGLDIREKGNKYFELEDRATAIIQHALDTIKAVEENPAD